MQLMVVELERMSERVNLSEESIFLVTVAAVGIEDVVPIEIVVGIVTAKGSSQSLVFFLK